MNTAQPRPKPGVPVQPNDLTIIYLTIQNTPAGFAARQRAALIAAAQGAPLIAVSRWPLQMRDWAGANVVLNPIQQVPEETDLWARTQNVYRQIRRAANLAETPYVAVAEDDCLYPAEHFVSYRPPPDTFAYNHSRWCMFSWVKRDPFYYHNPTDANCLLIAPRQLLCERLGKYDDFTREAMGELQRPCTAYYTHEPVLCYYHTQGNDYLERKRKKRPWPIQAYDIPRWGRAAEAISWWYE